MNIKRRTLNELRQTKDSHYANPLLKSEESNSSVIEGYLNFMRQENRISQASVQNFLMYLNKNDLRIIKR